MKTLTLAAVLCVIAGSAFAQGASCATQAGDKKLSGAAKTSFMNKCAKTDCDAQAAEKKLSGAAKNSFTTKCVKDSLAQ
jgi:hypothetical protein